MPDSDNLAKVRAHLQLYDHPLLDFSAQEINEAIEIAKRCPGLEYGAVVEVRPVADICSVKQRAEEYSPGQLAEATA